jgi:hypothetical protein
MTLIIIFAFIGGVSYFYLRGLYSLIDFRKNLHQGDIVSYKYGYKMFVSEVRRIPGEDIIEIRDLHTNNILLVGTSHIFPI